RTSRSCSTAARETSRWRSAGPRARKGRSRSWRSGRPRGRATTPDRARIFSVMLTRIEVDGFKNLLGFSAEFGPFTCIAGPNAVGKSNLFDAIEFLSLLADLPVKDAARRIRGGGEVRGLFYTDGKQRVDRMRFAVEMLTEAVITDDRGLRSDAAPNFYRYDLELELETSNELDASRSFVAREYLESVP